jgi:hypothetical protein
MDTGPSADRETGRASVPRRPTQQKETTRVITLSPELEAARRKVVTPEALEFDVLWERFVRTVSPIQPQDEWERRLVGAALDCSVSVPDSALSSDGLYE